MQVGGIGSGHSSVSHHVTNCIHEHSSTMKDAGAMGARSNMGGVGTLLGQTGQSGEGFSLSAWLADPIGKAKKLFGKVWNGGDGNAAEGISGKSLTENGQVMAEIAEDLLQDASSLGSTLHGGAQPGAGQPAMAQQSFPVNTIHNPQIAAAATALKPQDVMQGNPYFATVENADGQRQTIWRKMKVQFEAVAGFLTKRFAFSGKNSFQAKQEQPKEDLRKRSRYRSDNLDVECVLTDDSYLLDSYDRKGEYSRLSTKQ
ncbi:MAG: hypothetical protein NC094_12880 [Bacteroidales bacterium]|nr:hypothetical protein [Lachnoclostridium sp.]MCM1385529.1 hypothetical protein [Lachnoclostridium sp.]MCM1466300.1 hypothetical protein [Bacteroidales bacterium]